MQIKKSILGRLIILLFIITGSVFAEGGKMVGTTVIPSFSGPGVGLRVWMNPKSGWGLEAQPSWDFTDWNIRARYMYTTKTTKTTRYYVLVSAGFMSVNETEDMFDYSVSLVTFVVGYGYEKLFGVKKNKGYGFEMGYQIGSADYEMTILGMTMTNTFKVSPLYFGGSLAFYFKK